MSLDNLKKLKTLEQIVLRFFIAINRNPAMPFSSPVLNLPMQVGISLPAASVHFKEAYYSQLKQNSRIIMCWLKTKDFTRTPQGFLTYILSKHKGKFNKIITLLFSLKQLFLYAVPLTVYQLLLMALALTSKLRFAF